MHNSRIEWIDISRGMGIYLVILGHLVVSGTGLSIWIFSFHMPLFFFLSGYLSKLGKDSFITSLKKIINRLIVPYFVFVGIGFLISLIIPIWRPNNYRIVLYDIFYNVQPESLHVGQLWFLFCLAIVQFLFLFFLKMKIKKKLIIFILIFVFALISFFMEYLKIGFFIDGIFYKLPWKFDSAMMGLSFFSAGYYIKNLQLISFTNNFYKTKKINKVLIFFLLLEINVLFSLILNSGSSFDASINLGANIYGNLFYFLVASWAGICCIIYIANLIKKNLILSHIGKNSLSIFASHSFFLYFYSYILSMIFNCSFEIMKNIPFLLSILGAALITIASLMVPVLYERSLVKIIPKI